jgi:FkbM family methyltransferase
VEEFVKVTINDVSFFVCGNPYGWFWEKVNSADWENETFNLIDVVISKGNINKFVDIGVWIGPTALYAAAKGVDVIGFEPDPVAHAEVSRNISLNPALSRRIVINNLALSDFDGDVQMHTRGFGNSESSIFKLHQRAGEILDSPIGFWSPCVRGAAALRGVQSLESALIKIDIEGGEYVLIPEISEIMARYSLNVYLSLHPMNIVLEDEGAKQLKRISRTLDILDRFYDYNWYKPTWTSLELLSKERVISDVINDPLSYTNLFFSRAVF